MAGRDEKIVWKKVLVIRDENDIVTAYVFGPFMKLEHKHDGHIQVRSTYLDHVGHKYSSEASLIKHLDKISKKA